MNIAALAEARLAGPAGAARPTGRPVAVLTLALAVLPYVLGYVLAPHGATFLGALNNLGDLSQYLAALRQGAEGHLLYTDQYTSLRSAPVFIYPLYTATGLALGWLSLPTAALYHLLHLAGAIALACALWRACAAFAPRDTAFAFALALLGGGLYLPALLLSRLVPLPFAPVALTAPELSAFATLLLSPHGAVGLAAELWAITAYLTWRRERRARSLGALAAGGLLLALSYPFGVPVLLAVVGVDTLTRYRRPVPAWGLMRDDAALPLALLPPTAVALYYGALFKLDPLWGASNMVHMPPPGVAVLVAAFGPLAALALAGLLARRPHGTERESDHLLVIWALCNGLILLAPLPQSERLLSGWSVPLALLATRWLTPRPDPQQSHPQKAHPEGSHVRRPRARRYWTALLCCSNVSLALLYTLVTVTHGNAAYYETAWQRGAVAWLAAHAGPGDVVMASAGSGNLIVAQARCRVVVGQNFETFDWARVQADVLRYYASATTGTTRGAILRRYGVSYVVDGPFERGLGGYVPSGRDYRPVYVDGPLRIFAVQMQVLPRISPVKAA